MDSPSVETDSFEDDTTASGYSSIFQASLYFDDQEEENGPKQVEKEKYITYDREKRTYLDEVRRTPESENSAASELGTSEPSTAPPSMPGPQAQRRGEILAEMLFRRGKL
ncbi:hypothetical protein AA313_de0205271 [Arthrobotrys entomopaga]|nr:hypothetical protein AA313_de0205271 [Arthrobotrys entomopaga]